MHNPLCPSLQWGSRAASSYVIVDTETQEERATRLIDNGDGTDLPPLGNRQQARAARQHRRARQRQDGGQRATAS
jgi:hypothetical protein